MSMERSPASSRPDGGKSVVELVRVIPSHTLQNVYYILISSCISFKKIFFLCRSKMDTNKLPGEGESCFFFVSNEPSLDLDPA